MILRISSQKINIINFAFRFPLVSILYMCNTRYDIVCFIPRTRVSHTEKKKIPCYSIFSILFPRLFSLANRFFFRVRKRNLQFTIYNNTCVNVFGSWLENIRMGNVSINAIEIDFYFVDSYRN